MKIIPLLRCDEIKEAIVFYTSILDFDLKYPNEPVNDWGVDLINGDAEIQLTSMEGKVGIAINVRVDAIDNLFRKYVGRGLIIQSKEISPVHHEPIDQTWGMREFYVNDPSGNTLRFGMPINHSLI